MNAKRTAADVTLLVACAGRRVELVQAFRAAAAELGVGLRVVAADGARNAPALYAADAAELLPPIEDDDYIPALLRVAERHGADLLLPTIDTDLPKLADAREPFEALGCTALIGGPEAIRVCRDKVNTYRFLRDQGIAAPETWEPAALPAASALRYPLFLKPRSGSSSRSIHRIDTPADLDYHLARVEGAIVQSFVDGVEYTLDVYVGLTGVPRCVVPRRRLEVRTGEVAKGVTVKDPEIMAVGQRVAEAFDDSLRGLITVQLMVTPDRRMPVIEVNPRFGGGAPLGIAAGADFPRWLLEETLGREPAITFDGWQDGLMMLRYDWSVFVPDAALNAPAAAAVLEPPPPFRS